MKRTLSVGAVLAVCVVGLGCGGSDTKSTVRAGGAPPPVPVSVYTAEQKDMPVYLSGLGSVTAFNTVNIKSRVDGELVQVAFKEGEMVKKGDLLAVIDPRPYQVQLSMAEAQLFKDQASLRDAQLNYERFKGLLQDSGAMSQQQVDTQKALVDQLEGAVRSDQSAVDNAKLQLSYCHITAPVNGRIGLRLVDAGNIVHASDTNALLVITQLQPIAVIFTLPEDNLQAVAQRMRQGQLEVDAYSRDDRTKLASGTLLTVDNQIDQTTGTARLKAVFPNTDNVLWPNQFVNARMLLNTLKDAIIIPAAAIQRGPQGTFVFAVKPDKTVEVRAVTIAITQNNRTAIASGVSPGDVVVTDGQDKLQSGSKVEPRAATPANKPAQASGQP